MIPLIPAGDRLVASMLRSQLGRAARRGLPRLSATTRACSSAAQPPTDRAAGPLPLSDVPPVAGAVEPALQTVPVPVLEAAEPALRTVPVPVLVGPADASVVGAEGPSSAAAVDGAVSAVATMAENGGGWFFSRPMFCLETAMYTVHEASGLPWWATIAVTTFTVRLALFPLTVMQSRSVATMSKIRPKMDALTAKMKAASERAGGRGMEDAEKARLELQQLFATHNVRPWMTFVGALGQLPVWLTFFFTMRDITGRPGNALGMEDGGALWFTDLTTRDPTYGLPVLCGATFFAMVHLGDAGQTGKGAQRRPAPHAAAPACVTAMRRALRMHLAS